MCQKQEQIIKKLEAALEAMYNAYANEYKHRSEQGMGDAEIEDLKSKAEQLARDTMPKLNTCGECNKVVYTVDEKKSMMCKSCMSEHWAYF